MGATRNSWVGALVMMFLFTSIAIGRQDSVQFKPMYVTVTTLHWNPDPEADFSDWMDTEKEYFDKVISKNDLIKATGVYMHYFTADNSEIVFATLYENWDDIEKAEEKNQELMKEAWPDEDARTEFLQKQNSFYSTKHSDEIYTTMQYYKPLQMNGDEPQVVYVRSSDLAMNGEGKVANFKEYNEKVVQKNPVIKGYYSHRHAWGSNGREMVEVFIYDDLCALEESVEENQRLASENWPDEDERDTFMGDMNKLFTGHHSDYIYRTVPALFKSPEEPAQ